jgi:hypothetical protein
MLEGCVRVCVWCAGVAGVDACTCVVAVGIDQVRDTVRRGAIHYTSCGLCVVHVCVYAPRGAQMGRVEAWPIHVGFGFLGVLGAFQARTVRVIETNRAQGTLVSLCTGHMRLWAQDQASRALLLAAILSVPQKTLKRKTQQEKQPVQMEFSTPRVFLPRRARWDEYVASHAVADSSSYSWRPQKLAGWGCSNVQHAKMLRTAHFLIDF